MAIIGIDLGTSNSAAAFLLADGLSTGHLIKLKSRSGLLSILAVTSRH